MSKNYCYNKPSDPPFFGGGAFPFTNAYDGDGFVRIGINDAAVVARNRWRLTLTDVLYSSLLELLQRRN